MFDWNDLKYLVAVARCRSTSAAGRSLGVNQSTVQRRLAELERAIGHPLVQRHPSGYRLTALGEQLLPWAEQVEQAVVALARQIDLFQHDVQGVVRLSCPEPLVFRLSQSGLLDRFHACYPGLRVEFVVSDKYLDFPQAHLDIALRSGDTDDGALVGRKLGDSLWAVYASASYLAQRTASVEGLDLTAHDWVDFDDSMAQHRASVWLRQVVPGAHVVARNNSVLGLLYSTKAGMGLAALPTALGDAEPDLVRVLGPVPELTRIWRVLTTPELRRTPRVAALFDFLVDEIETLRPIITG